MKALLSLAGPVAAALACVLPAQAAAQDVVPDAQAAVPEADQPDEPGWRFSITPYGWLNGVQGRVGAGGTETEVDVGLGDAFDHGRDRKSPGR